MFLSVQHMYLLSTEARRGILPQDWITDGCGGHVGIGSRMQGYERTASALICWAVASVPLKIF